MINDQELTIVLVGKIEKNFESNVNQIKKFYPNSPIIVSTFDDLPAGFKHRHILHIKGIDPGFSVKTENGHLDNLGRQVVQNNNALEKVKTEYVLKIRSDIKLVKKIDFFDFQSDKIYIPPVFFRDPVKFPFLFHPSDVAQLGNTKLVRDFWNASNHEAFVCALPNRKRKLGVPLSSWVWHLVPEQRLFLNYIKSRFGFNYKLPYSTYSNFELFKTSEHYLREVFDLISQNYFRYPSHFQRIRPGIWSCYSKKSWNNRGKMRVFSRSFLYLVNNFIVYKFYFLVKHVYLKFKYVLIVNFINWTS